VNPDASPTTKQHRLSTETIEAITGRPPGDLELYERALTHRSHFRGRSGAALGSYERTEFLGDALLGFAVATHLFERFPEKTEGELTRLRARLVNGESLAERARSLGLGEHLRMSKNAARTGRDNPSLLADAYEALVGALYRDHGMDAARDFIRRTLLSEADLNRMAGHGTNFKSCLQEHVQARGDAQPSYRIARAEGPSHDRTFTAEVLLDGEVHGSGTGPSKQRAEQQAAEEALGRLREVS
jgi:ribonuclease-3